MPRYPVQKEANPEVLQPQPEAPTVRRLSSSDLELAPVTVHPVAQETIELAPDPFDEVTAAVNAVVDPVTAADLPNERERAEAEVVLPEMRPIAVEDKPLHLMTREELMERLNAINASTKLARPLNELPGPRPTLTERQMTQRDAELARGAERNAQHAATQGPRRPPLTALVPGRPQSGAPAALRPLPAVNPPVPASEVSARAPDDKEYVPDMRHGHTEKPADKAWNESHKG